MDNHDKIIYLTGAPASGKSTLCQSLKIYFKSELFVFEYGNELMKYLQAQQVEISNQSELRNKSSKIIRPEDIKAVDAILLQFIESNRDKGYIIVDSHAVTKEYYGFRITPFSYEQVQSLPFTDIYVLYCESEVIRNRIKENSGGRPLITNFEADMHTFLQASVAINYGITMTVPIYFFNTAVPPETLLENIVKRMRK